MDTFSGVSYTLLQPYTSSPGKVPFFVHCPLLRTQLHYAGRPGQLQPHLSSDIVEVRVKLARQAGTMHFGLFRDRLNVIYSSRCYPWREGLNAG